MNKKLNFRGLAIIAGALMISTSAMAESSDSVVIQRTTVKFDRSVASTPAGAEVLYTELSQAASRVCVDNSSPLVAQGGRFAECRSAALGQAVGKVNIQAISELYSKDGRVRSPQGSVTVY